MGAELKITIAEDAQQSQHAAEPARQAPMAPQHQNPPQQAQQPLPQQPAKPAQQQMPPQNDSAKPPERRFSKEQWESIPEKERLAVAKQYGMAPPEGAQQAAQPHQQWQNREIEAKASERLQKLKEQQAVEMSMRAQSPEYRTAKESRDDRDANLEYRRSKLEERTSRERAQYGTPENALNAQQQQKDEDFAAKQEKRDAERRQRDAEKAEQQQQRNEDYIAKLEKRDAERHQRDSERAAQQQMRNEDYIAKQEKRDAERQEKQAQRAIQYAEREETQGRQRVAQTVAMGGAAIGGMTGRMMGFASQIIASKQAMDMIGGVWDKVTWRRVANEVAAPVPQDRAQQTAQPPVANAAQSFQQKAPYDTTTGYDAAKAPPAINRHLSDAQQTAKPIPPQMPTAAHAPPGSGNKMPPTAAVAPPGSASSAPYALPAPPAANNAPVTPAGGGAALGLAEVAAPLAAVAAPLAAAGAILVGAYQLASMATEKFARSMEKSVDEVTSITVGLASLDSKKVAMQVAETASGAVTEVVGFFEMGLGAAFGSIVAGPVGGVIGAVVGNALGDVLNKTVVQSVRALGQLDQAVEMTAKRLSDYSGVLANQTAQQENREMMREISRAQRNGETIAAANGPRFEMEQKLSDITDRFIPFVMKISQGIFEEVGSFLEIVDDGIKKGLSFADAVIAALQEVIRFVSAGTVNLALLQNIRDLLHEANTDSDASSNIDLFMRGATNLGDGSVNRQAVSPTPAIQTPNVFNI